MLCRASTVGVMAMRVGELARRTGVGVSTLRAWERRYGILDPDRSSSGHRLYTEDDVERVSAVCRLVDEGLTLSAAIGRVASAGSAAFPTGESELLFLHQMAEAADHGIWVSREGRTRYANRRMAELLDCSMKDLMTRPVLDFVDPAAVETVRERGPLVRDGQRQRFKVRLRRADGSFFVAEISTTPLLDRAGNYGGAVGVVTDVTARVRDEFEAQIRATLLNAASEAAMAAAPDGTMLYFNPAAERLFGWRVSEVLGKNGLEIFPGLGAASDAGRVHARLVAKKRYMGEILLTRRDRTEFVAYMIAVPVVDEDGELIALGAVFNDRSERVRLDREVRTIALQAETVALLGARALRRQPTPEQSTEMILTEVVDATRRVLEGDRATIVEVTAGLEGLVRAASPPVEERAAVAAGSQSLAGYTALARKVVLVEDARAERRFEIDPGNPDRRVLSAIAAPVFGPEGVCAVLTAESSTPKTFDRTAVHFLQGMANVVGVVLQ
jgi:PAS domain S-box-containing protein